MTEEEKDKLIEDFVAAGSLPDKENFTREEVWYLVQTALSWATTQIEATIDQTLHKKEDIPSLVANCEFKTIEEGIEDVEDTIRDEFAHLQAFILDWVEKKNPEIWKQ